MNPFSQPTQAQLIGNQVMNESRLLLTNKKNGLTRIFNLSYYGKPVITSTDQPLPLEQVQAVFDVFGTNGVLLFQGAGLEIQGITFADPSYVSPVPPYPYVINADGTVTFSAPAPVTPPTN